MVSFVATPIGNLGDITFRAVETLKNADEIWCEDTRHTLRLLNAYEIKKPLFACHKFNERQAAEKIAAAAQSGKNIAVVSDAGMPVVSDPGNIVCEVLKEKGVPGLDGVLMDLGVSSHQLDEASRGFSFHTDAPLDMRMSQTGMTAADLVNTAEESELSRILFTYGEERFARNIARKIVAAREIAPIRTTKELAEIILSGVPAQQRRAKNPCRQCFQAIRIAVNGEFEHLEAGLKAAFSMLKPGGRLAVITFHSLEDRIVKQQFAQWCRGCICPPDFPVCVCGRTPEAKLVVKKPVIPTPEEQERNSRSRSAKLRVIERSR